MTFTKLTRHRHVRSTRVITIIAVSITLTFIIIIIVIITIVVVVRRYYYYRCYYYNSEKREPSCRVRESIDALLLIFWSVFFYPLFPAIVFGATFPVSRFFIFFLCILLRDKLSFPTCTLRRRALSPCVGLSWNSVDFTVSDTFRDGRSVRKSFRIALVFFFVFFFSFDLWLYDSHSLRGTHPSGRARWKYRVDVWTLSKRHVVYLPDVRDILCSLFFFRLSLGFRSDLINNYCLLRMFLCRFSVFEEMFVIYTCWWRPLFFSV